MKNNLYLQLFQVAIIAKHDLMNTADEFGLSVMQLYTLCLLANNKSIPMNSLSNMLHCDASNITGIVDRLFVHKFITRDENPDDRREKMIKLTLKGDRLCNKISEKLNSMRPDYLRSLNSDKKKLLEELLTIMLDPTK